ncbi:MAG: hypothetical protein AB2821_10370 [Candidatus Thiodiazotropha endolucinida]
MYYSREDRREELEWARAVLKRGISTSRKKAQEQKRIKEFALKLMEGDDKTRMHFMSLKRRKEYQLLFFEKTSADVDYNNWGKMPLITPEEAAALWFGKDPEEVTLESVKPFTQESDFPKKFMQTCLLIDRAVSAGELPSESSLIKPTDFLKWAKQNNLNIPNELINAIEGHSKNMETEEQNPGDVLLNSKRWVKLESAALGAIKEYRYWHHQKVKEGKRVNTDLIKDWIHETYGISQNEALIIKYVLQEIYPEIVPSR